MLKPALQLKLGQQLTMTPQLQQAIKLLQLSNLDLTTFVEEELERNRGGQPLLWAQGISGDWPIVLAMLDAADGLPTLRQLLTAHRYWRRRGMMVDLVIINEAEVRQFTNEANLVKACRQILAGLGTLADGFTAVVEERSGEASLFGSRPRAAPAALRRGREAPALLPHLGDHGGPGDTADRR